MTTTIEEGGTVVVTGARVVVVVESVVVSRDSIEPSDAATDSGSGSSPTSEPRIPSPTNTAAAGAAIRAHLGHDR